MHSARKRVLHLNMPTKYPTLPRSSPPACLVRLKHDGKQAESDTGIGLRHRIMSVPAPRMATGNSFDCQPAPLECAIFAYGFQSILRTGRSIAASWRNHRTDAVLVKLDQPLQQLGNHDFCNSSRWSCARISSAPSRPKGRRTRITKSRGGNCALCRRNQSRNTRFI